jgi:hypothetical protein
VNEANGMAAMSDMDVERSLWDAIGKITQVIHAFELRKDHKVEEMLRLRAAGILVGDVISMERKLQKFKEKGVGKAKDKPS